MNQGSCLCGDIRWEISDDPMLMSNCHCSMCRKMHGGAFGTYIGVPATAFRWLAGESKVQTYESSPGGLRPFCPRCGSIVASRMRDGDSVFMPAGNVDGDWKRRLDNHIFVGSKAPWFEITDDAPRFDAYPDGYDMTGVDNPERPPSTGGAIGGSCLCNAVAFELDETLGRMGCCHCSRCRKSRSSAHSAQTFAAIDKFRWLRGQDRVRSFQVPESDFFVTSFCDTCASKLPTVHTAGGVVLVPAGALDQDPGVRPQGHIFVGSKAPWL